MATANIEVRSWSVRNPDNSRKTPQEISDQLRSVIAEVDPAILHFNSLSTSRIGGPIARELGIPTLGYLRDILKLSKKAISDLNQNDCIIAVSQATRQWHINQGLDPRKTHTVYNGIDSNFFRPAIPEDRNHWSDIRSELSIPSDAAVLIFVGQIGIRKGVDILIESFFSIAASTDAHLLVIGQRHSQKEEAIQYEANLIAKVDSSDFRDRVHWLGRRTDIAEIMRQATLLIHPARQEPLGRVLLESAASGLPLVTTNVGGSSEILRDGGEDSALSRQLLVDLPDNQTSARDDLNKQLSDLISQRVLKLLENPSQRVEIGKQLRQRATDTFSILRCATQLNSYYSRLLEEI